MHSGVQVREFGPRSTMTDNFGSTSCFGGRKSTAVTGNETDSLIGDSSSAPAALDREYVDRYMPKWIEYYNELTVAQSVQTAQIH
jgi:hypothetical protein